MSRSRPRKEPLWLNRVVVDAIHLDQVREHGGRLGVRDENALESALARPQQRWAYDSEADISTLGAAYAFGFVKNHPYVDGNKRIGFLAMVTFLGVNGVEFDAPEDEVVAQVVMLADGNVSEAQFADWIRRSIPQG